MKKLLSLIACVMMCSVATASDDLGWRGGRLVISADAGLTEWMTHRAASKDEVIELELRGGVDLGITAYDGLFSECGDLERVVCDIDTARSLGNYTFQNCTSLSYVDLSNISTIGTRAFENCTSLKSITLPKRVNTVAQNAFKGAGLERVVFLRENNITIGASAFENCKSLSRVELAGTARSINDDAFKGTSTDLQVIMRTSSEPITGATNTTPFPDGNATIHLNEDAPMSVRATAATRLGVDVSRVVSDLHIKSGDAMLFDGDAHWYVCVSHKISFDVEPHSYGEALADGSRICTACGRVKPADRPSGGDNGSGDGGGDGNDNGSGDGGEDGSDSENENENNYNEDDNGVPNGDAETDGGSQSHAHSLGGACGAGSFAIAALYALIAVSARRRSS